MDASSSSINRSSSCSGMDGVDCGGMDAQADVRDSNDMAVSSSSINRSSSCSGMDGVDCGGMDAQADVRDSNDMTAAVWMHRLM